jgi:hypothetical protein
VYDTSWTRCVVTHPVLKKLHVLPLLQLLSLSLSLLSLSSLSLSPSPFFTYTHTHSYPFSEKEEEGAKYMDKRSVNFL